MHYVSRHSITVLKYVMKFVRLSSNFRKDNAILRNIKIETMRSSAANYLYEQEITIDLRWGLEGN